MSLGFALILPPILCFLILAALPKGKIAFIGIAVALALWAFACAAIYPLGPAIGPDDWFHGIEIIPLWLSLGSIMAVFVAQLFRWQRYRKGKRSYYLAVLGLCVVIPVAVLVYGFG